MNVRSLLLVGVGVVVLALLGFVMFFGVFQEAIYGAGAFSEVDCLGNVKEWCSKGYACTGCSLRTLSYSLVFEQGVTNRVWNADCVFGSANTQDGHTACLSPSLVTKNSGSKCVDGTIYWSNSDGSVGYLKEFCKYGCSPTIMNFASCRSAPPAICWSSDQVCSSGTASPLKCFGSIVSCGVGQYCSNGKCVLQSGQVVGKTPCLDKDDYCVSDVNYSSDGSYIEGCNVLSCPSGTICQNDASGNHECIAKSPSCTDECSIGVFPSCVGVNQYRVCKLNPATGCYVYDSNNYCLGGQSCSNGLCIKKVVPTCDSSQVCLSESQVKVVASDCSETIFACPTGQSCDDGVCVGEGNVTDKCLYVSCIDSCDDKFNLRTNGFCEPLTGGCIYANIITNSEECRDTYKECFACLNNELFSRQVLQTESCPAGYSIEQPESCGDVPFFKDCYKCVDGGLSNERVLQSELCPAGYSVKVPDCTKSFFEKYGLYIGIAVIIALLLVYVMMGEKKNKRKR